MIYSLTSYIRFQLPSKNIMLLLTLLVHATVLAEQKFSGTHTCDQDPIACYHAVGSKDFVNDKAYFKFVAAQHKRAKESAINFIDYNRFLLEITKNISYIDRNEAYGYLYELSLNSERLKTEKVDFLADIYQALGGSYFYFKHYVAAKTQYHLALKEKKCSDLVKIDCLNSLGLIERIYSNPQKACDYFSQALELATSTNNKAWIGVISGNLGTCKQKLGKIEEARKLLNIDFKLSQENGDFVSAYLAFLGLAELDLSLGNTKDAEDKIRQTESKINENRDLRDDKDFLNSFHIIRSKLYFKTANYKLAYQELELASNLKDKTNLERERLDLAKMEFQINFEKQTRDREILYQKQRNKELSYLLLLILGLVSLVALVVYYKKQLNKRKEANLLLQQENSRRKLELEEANAFINQIKHGIVEKNKIIEELNEQIENLADITISSEMKEQKLEQLDQLKTSVVLTEDDWTQFKRTFEKLYPSFIPSLMKINPSLTNAEIRLATLMKLNLSTSEISNTLGISADSVRKTNLRLRNKLEFKKQEDLISLLSTLK
jgi:DNA-binding CsgD family transcriptional regulator